MDYCEIILNAVHKVVSTEIALQAYETDSFIVAKIIDIQSKEIPYQYLVQDDNGKRFAVKSENFKLNLNESVYILGNSIIGKKLMNSELPIAINEGLKDFIGFNTYLGNGLKIVQSERIFNRLLIVAKLSSAAIITDDSDYTISVQITEKNGLIYEIVFNKQDLIGSIDFLNGTLQKQLYSLNLSSNITHLNIEYNTSIYQEVEVTFGNDAASLSNEMGLTLSILEENLEYQTDHKGIIQNKQFTPQWSWIYTEENVLYLKTSADINLDNININYYLYDQTYNQGDQYGGLYWKKIELIEGKISSSYFSSTADKTKIKAVLIYDKIIETSNEIEFTNIKAEREGNITNLRISFQDGRNGIYPFYSYDGTMQNKYVAQGESVKYRELNINFNFMTHDIPHPEIESVIWHIPLNNIVISPSKKNTTIQYVNNNTAALIDVTRQTKTNSEGKLEPNYIVRYRLKQAVQLTTGSTEEIFCTIKIKNDPIEYKVTDNMQFSVSSQGSSKYQIINELYQDGRLVNGIRNTTSGYILRVSVWNSIGEKISNYKISSQFWYGQNSSKTENSLSIINNYNIAIDGLFKVEESVQKSYIIQYTVDIYDEEKEKTIIDQVTMLYPLRLYKMGEYVFDMPIELEYDFSNKPTFEKMTNRIRVYSKGTGEEIFEEDKDSWILKLITNTSWNENGQFTIDAGEDIVVNHLTTDWAPKLRKNSFYYNIVLPNIYNSSINKDYYLCNLVLYHKGSVTAIQPIVIYQNTEFSAYVDQWGGKLTIDEENNAIMSASMVAGKKEDNKFTGVIIGDIENIQSVGKSKKSGIMAFNAGVQTFGVSDKGDVYAKGEIEADRGRIGGLYVNKDRLIYPLLVEKVENLFDINSLVGYIPPEVKEYSIDYNIFAQDESAHILLDEEGKNIGIVMKYNYNTHKSSNQLLVWPTNIVSLQKKKYTFEAKITDMTGTELNNITIYFGYAKYGQAMNKDDSVYVQTSNSKDGKVKITIDHSNLQEEKIGGLLFYTNFKDGASFTNIEFYETSNDKTEDYIPHISKSAGIFINPNSVTLNKNLLSVYGGTNSINAGIIKTSSLQFGNSATLSTKLYNKTVITRDYSSGVDQEVELSTSNTMLPDYGILYTTEGIASLANLDYIYPPNIPSKFEGYSYLYKFNFKLSSPLLEKKEIKFNFLVQYPDFRINNIMLPDFDLNWEYITFRLPDRIIEKTVIINTGMETISVYITKEDIYNSRLQSSNLSIINVSPSGPGLPGEWEENGSYYTQFRYNPDDFYWFDNGYDKKVAYVTSPNPLPVDPLITYNFSSDNTVYFSGILAPGYGNGELSQDLLINNTGKTLKDIIDSINSLESELKEIKNEIDK